VTEPGRAVLFDVFGTLTASATREAHRRAGARWLVSSASTGERIGSLAEVHALVPTR
jgi:hypothetical protein